MQEDSVNKLSNRVWSPWATTGFGVLAFIVYNAAQVFTALIITFILAFIHPEWMADLKADFQSFLPHILERLGLLTGSAIIVSTVLGIGFILLIIKLSRGKNISDYLCLHPIKFKTGLCLIGVILLFIVIVELLTNVLGRQYNQEFEITLYRTSVWPALFALAAVICAPVFEEILFRGFLLEGFRFSRIGNIGAILITAFLWAVIHVQYDFFLRANIFLLGIILGIARIKTNSLYAPVLMHSFNNLIAFVILVLHVDYGLI